MKKILIIISLAVMTLMVASCTEDATSEGTATVEQMYKGMMASYRGSYPLNNIPQQIYFTIDEQSNVIVNRFPLNLVFVKLYPQDYSSITEPEEAVSLKAPIKGFNLNTSFIEFSTDLDNTEPLRFKFMKDGEEHTGWAMVHVVGVYNQSMTTMTIQFTVTDLVIDNVDMKDMIPIHYFVDSAMKEISK